jgi:CDGSH-type Zn-finger protein
MNSEDKEFCIIWHKFEFDFDGTEMPFIRDAKKYFNKLNLIDNGTDNGSYMMFYNKPKEIKYTGFNTLLTFKMLEKGFCLCGVSNRGAFTDGDGTKFVTYFKTHTPKEIYDLIFSEEYEEVLNNDPSI